MAQGARQGHAARDEDRADAGVRHGARAGVMDGEPRLATRAPDGQVLREWDRYSADAARALQADLERALGARSTSARRRGRSTRPTPPTTARCRSASSIRAAATRSSKRCASAASMTRRSSRAAAARASPARAAMSRCASTSRATCTTSSRSIRTRGCARVEPGCILDRLNDAAAPHGLTFGPDPATHSRNTLGGMIGNDSCGVHSVKWGRTRRQCRRAAGADLRRAAARARPDAAAEYHRRDRPARRHLPRAGRAARPLRQADRGALPKIPRLVSGLRGARRPAPRRRLQRRARGDRHRGHVRDRARSRAAAGAAAALQGDRACCRSTMSTRRRTRFPRCSNSSRTRSRGSTASSTTRCARPAPGTAALTAFPEGARLPDRRGRRRQPRGSRSERPPDGRRGADRRAHARRVRSRTSSSASGRRAKRRSARPRSSHGQPEHWPGWEDSAVPPDKLGDLSARSRTSCSPRTAIPPRSTAISATA